jgi:hypothetical protein
MTYSMVGRGVRRVTAIDDEGRVQKALKFDEVISGRTLIRLIFFRRWWHFPQQVIKILNYCRRHLEIRPTLRSTS